MYPVCGPFGKGLGASRSFPPKRGLAGAQWGMTQGAGNEPKGDSLKENHKGSFIGVIPAFPAEHQQVVFVPKWGSQECADEEFWPHTS